MANVNLLPPELGPKASVLKVVVLIKKAVTGFLFVFLILGVAAIAFTYYLNLQLKKSTNSQEALKVSIRSLEQTEQKLYLVKDRLSKIKSVLALNTSAKELETLDQITSADTSGINMTGIEVTAGKINVTGSAVSSDILGAYIDTILANPVYKTIKLAGFTYNPKSGYSFGLDIVTK